MRPVDTVMVVMTPVLAMINRGSLMHDRVYSYRALWLFVDCVMGSGMERKPGEND